MPGCDYYGGWAVTIYQGDVLDRLRELPGDHYHCVVTSPPYWKMRDYGVEGQMGQEKIFDCTIVPTINDNKIVRCGECYICKMVTVFDEVRRVLRPDGVLWLNMGDNMVHHTVPGGNAPMTVKYSRERDDVGFGAVFVDGLKRKDMVGQPWRLAMHLQVAGWWLRSDIIWHKPNPMPSSVKDRPTRSHEHIFLLAKSERYFYDGEAIADDMKFFSNKMPDGWDTGLGAHGGYHRDGREKGRKMPPIGGIKHVDENGNPTYSGNRPEAKPTANKRDVWTIPTQAYSEAHYATFPEELARLCLAAGTSLAGCCGKCGAPRKRVLQETSSPHDGETDSKYKKGSNANRIALVRQAARERGAEYKSEVKTLGWESGCKCGAKIVPCRAMDIFLGSGTTMRVAMAMDLDCDGIELSLDNVAMAERRIKQPFGRSGKKIVKNDDQIGLEL